MNANDVITIGRSRSWQAEGPPRGAKSPSSRWRLANSTIRIAFLLARPNSTTKPISREDIDVDLRIGPHERLGQQPRHDVHADDRAQKAHRHDEDHRQRQRPAFVLRRQHEEYRRPTASPKMTIAVLPACSSRKAISVHSYCIELRQVLVGQLLHHVDRLRANSRPARPGRGSARRRACCSGCTSAGR